VLVHVETPVDSGSITRVDLGYGVTANGPDPRYDRHSASTAPRPVVSTRGRRFESLSMEVRITLQLTIEVGGRAGMIRPRLDTFSGCRGRPCSPDELPYLVALRSGPTTAPSFDY